MPDIVKFSKSAFLDIFAQKINQSKIVSDISSYFLYFHSSQIFIEGHSLRNNVACRKLPYIMLMRGNTRIIEENHTKLISKGSFRSLNINEAD